MLLAALVLVIALAVGYVLGGRLTTLGHLRLRHRALVVIALLVQVAGGGGVRAPRHHDRDDVAEPGQPGALVGQLVPRVVAPQQRLGGDPGASGRVGGHRHGAVEAHDEGVAHHSESEQPGAVDPAVHDQEGADQHS